jgi:hypothetical protein
LTLINDSPANRLNMTAGEDRAAMSVTRNVGRADRWLRVALGVTLFLFALLCPFAARLGPLAVWGSGGVGVVLIATVVLGFCPIYRLFGLRS